MQAEDTSPKDMQPSIIHHGSTMMSNRLLEGGREPTEQKEGPTMKKLSQKHCNYTRQVKTIVKQEKRSKELSIARICKQFVNTQEFLNTQKLILLYQPEKKSKGQHKATQNSG